MSGAHAPFAPSAMSRVIACPGSWGLSKPYIEMEEDSPAAMEGTAAHWVAAEMFEGRVIEVDSEAPNGVLVTNEMLDGAELMMDCLPLGDGVQVEQPVDCSVLHPDCHGTPDYWQFDRARLTLHVYDYKFGHRYVPAFENWQLISYAAGILAGLGITGVTDDLIKVHLHVVQPRNYHHSGQHRTWPVNAAMLRAYFNRIRTACEDASQPFARCTPNPECDYCPGRRACEALQNSAMGAAELSAGNQAHDLTPAAAGAELRTIKRAIARLKARESGLEEQVFAIVSGGRKVRGWTLQGSTGRRKWTSPVSEILLLGEALQIDVSKPGVVTPLQAIKAGIPSEVVMGFSETSGGALKLVEEDTSQLRQGFSTQGVSES